VKSSQVAVSCCAHELEGRFAVGSGVEMAWLDLKVVDVLENNRPPGIHADRPPALVHDPNADVLDVARILVHLVEQRVETRERRLESLPPYRCETWNAIYASSHSTAALRQSRIAVNGGSCPAARDLFRRFRHVLWQRAGGRRARGAAAPCRRLR
jgi:hypothetical protein